MYINSSEITANRAIYGGGILADNGSHVTVLRSNINQNNATWGGGIRAENSCSLAVLGSSLDNNTATSNGGGLNVAINVSVSATRLCTGLAALLAWDLGVPRAVHGASMAVHGLCTQCPWGPWSSMGCVVLTFMHWVYACVPHNFEPKGAGNTGSLQSWTQAVQPGCQLVGQIHTLLVAHLFCKGSACQCAVCWCARVSFPVRALLGLLLRGIQSGVAGEDAQAAGQCEPVEPNAALQCVPGGWLTKFSRLAWYSVLGD